MPEHDYYDDDGYDGESPDGPVQLKPEQSQSLLEVFKGLFNKANTRNDNISSILAQDPNSPQVMQQRQIAEALQQQMAEAAAQEQRVLSAGNTMTQRSYQPLLRR